MPTLYELADGLAAALAAATDDETGELIGDLETALDEHCETFEAKFNAVLGFRAGLVRDAEAIEAEAKRLRDRAAALKNRADRLKAYVLDCMKRAGLPKLKTPFFSAWIAKNSRPSFTLADPDFIPWQFAKQKIEFDDAKALEAWKAAGHLPPSIQVAHGEHLQIR